VIIVAATNRPDIIDKALTRPGRFDHLIYVPPPDFEGRLQIFKLNIRKMPIDTSIGKNCKLVDLQDLAGWTEGYSGAEISLVCREAGLSALSSDINSELVLMKDFEHALKKVKSRITKELLDYYKNF
jgi:transitional endoplasmic reticulum ATPase